MGESECTLCHGALPPDEWCRACGRGKPEPDPEPEHVKPMHRVQVAIRDAKGGFLSTDGGQERAAYRAAKRLARGSAPSPTGRDRG